MKELRVEEPRGDQDRDWEQREQELLQWYRREEGPRDWDDGQRSGNGENHLVPSRSQIWVKLILSAILFGLVWGIFHIDQPWADKGKQFVAQALTKDMEYQSLAAWYRSKFDGAPSFLPAFGIHKKEEAAKVDGRPVRYYTPVKGTLISSFTPSRQGVYVETATDAKAAAMDAGRILFAGSRDDTGYTVVLQHAGGFRTEYGNLKPAKWQESDWIKAGDVIGTVEEDPGTGKGRFYFAVMKDQRYVNPSDVVSFD